MRTNDHCFVGPTGKLRKNLAGVFATCVCGNIHGSCAAGLTCVSEYVVLFGAKIYARNEVMLSEMGVVVAFQGLARDVKRGN